MATKPKKPTDFFLESKKVMDKESVARAEEAANREILQIRLSELRESAGIKQTDIPGFSQTSISRLEARKDLKLSTLVEYVHALGYDLEIKAKPREKRKKSEFVLLKK